MDLRPLIRTPADILRAKELIAQDHFFYQPFRFADDLEVGGGYEFVNRKPGAGMVYWPAYEQERERFAGPRLRTVDPALVSEFRQANELVRRQYDGFVEQICERVPGIESRTVADIGCWNGYMPVSFALRGAREAVGYDQIDRSGGFRYLNRLLGANARFVHARYDFVSGTMRGCPGHDIVISMSVLQHMTEPLRHLHFLRSITREALFLMTNVWDDDEYLMRYGEPNATSNYAFPWSFDNSIYLSEKLLRKALQEAGFARIVELEFRGPAGVRQAAVRGSHDYATAGAHRQTLTGRALLCFVDGPATGAQASLGRGSYRLSGSHILALLRRMFPRLSGWALRKVKGKFRA